MKMKQGLTPNDQSVLSDDDLSFIWDWAKHEDELFTNRANFFLISEAMLFAALVTLNDDAQRLNYLIIGCGAVISVLWFVVSSKNIRFQARLKNYLIASKKIYFKVRSDQYPDRDIMEKPGLWHRLTSVHTLMGKGLPVLFLVTWLAIVFLR